MKPVFLSLLLLSIAACSSGPDSTDNEEQDSIEILSISPEIPTIGAETEFEVEIRYKLGSSEQGEINLGFNETEFERFEITQSLVIEQGQGEMTVLVTATPKDYEPTGQFAGYANVVEFPHDTVFTPLDSDIFFLTVRPPFDPSTGSVTASSQAIRGQSTNSNQSNGENEIRCFSEIPDQCIQY